MREHSERIGARLTVAVPLHRSARWIENIERNLAALPRGTTRAGYYELLAEALDEARRASVAFGPIVPVGCSLRRRRRPRPAVDQI